MKKILIDAVSLLSPLTGIGRYTYEISLRLQKLSQDKYEIFFNYGYHSKELYGLSNKQSTAEQKAKRLQAFIKKSQFLKKITRTLYAFIAKFHRVTYELYWQPSFIPNPNIKAKKVICTIHDFSFLLHPQWHPKERIEYLQTHLCLAKKADHIITGSNFTKQEIIRYMQIPNENISVIYHGVDHKLYKPYPQNELQETKAKYDLHEKFLLFVGSIEPRKNLLTLLKAYNLFSEEQKKAFPLVLVGFKGWENREIMQEIEKNKGYIRYLGYVSDEELAHLYNLCALFIYPSLYEGFGLPPLEAMACGAAVITSNVASLPEVCGNAALYVEPTNPQDIKDKITLLIESEMLQKELSKKSLSQATHFSWENAAEKHFKIFQGYLS
ncbi:MAG: glycosyltransferase family 1 protein [Sulfurimonas sp.]